MLLSVNEPPLESVTEPDVATFAKIGSVHESGNDAPVPGCSPGRSKTGGWGTCAREIVGTSKAAAVVAKIFAPRVSDRSLLIFAIFKFPPGWYFSSDFHRVRSVTAVTS